MRGCALMLFVFVLLTLRANARSGAVLKSYADKYYFIDSIFSSFEGFGSEKAIESYNKLIKIVDGWNDKELVAELNLARIRKIALDGNKGSSIKEADFRNLLGIARQIKSGYLEADVTKCLGDYFDFYKKYGLVFESYLSAYSIYSRFTAAEFPPKRQYIYSLGIEYYHYGDIESALKYLLEAENTTPARDDKYINPIENAIGLCYRSMGRYDSAEWYYKKIYDAAVKRDDKQWIGISIGNIGICYYLQKRYSEATPLLKEDIETSLQSSQLRNAVGSMYILANIRYILNNYEEAEDLLRRGLSLAESRSFWPDYQLALQYYTLLSKICSEKQDFKEAYLYSDSALVAKDSLNARFNAVTFAKIQEKVDFAERKRKEEQLASEEKLQLLIRDFLIAFIFLLSIIGILFINRQRLKRKKLEAEKQNAEADLVAASQMLEGFRQSVQEKNTLIENFSGEIERMKQGVNDEVDREVLLKLEHSIILTDQQWEDFRVLFEKVHKGFFNRVKEKMPDLTPSEIRFVALSKLKLSPKEMAAMLGISANSIRNYRLRLRRKLGLGEEAAIEEIVDSI